MWTKPWTFKEGFLIGGGLIFAGLTLQLSAGPVDWDSFAWPANGIALSVFLTAIAHTFLLRKKVYAFQFLSTYQTAIPAMVYAVGLTIIMGLTRQQKGGFIALTTATLGNADMQRVRMITAIGEPEWRAPSSSATHGCRWYILAST